MLSFHTFDLLFSLPQAILPVAQTLSSVWSHNYLIPTPLKWGKTLNNFHVSMSIVQKRVALYTEHRVWP